MTLLLPMSDSARETRRKLSGQGKCNGYASVLLRLTAP
jgi:hypothetical protein